MNRIRTITLGVVAVLAGRAGASSAATPRLDDYAQGVAIDLISQQPVVRLNLPDAVYQSVVTSDLSDVRVFNADGVPVPHALCAAPSKQEASISQESLPVYR